MAEEKSKPEEKKVEKQMESKEENKQKVEKIEKKTEKKIERKEVAVARGISVPVSTKHCMALCNMIKGKKLDRAIELLDLVARKKIAAGMNAREVPHRKNVMAGRFPLNASREMIHIVKQLKANSSVNGIENPKITAAIANIASRPFKRGGARTKRTHIYLEAKTI